MEPGNPQETVVFCVVFFSGLVDLPRCLCVCLSLSASRRYHCGRCGARPRLPWQKGTGRTFLALAANKDGETLQALLRPKLLPSTLNCSKSKSIAPFQTNPPSSQLSQLSPWGLHTFYVLWVGGLTFHLCPYLCLWFPKALPCQWRQGVALSLLGREKRFLFCSKKIYERHEPSPFYILGI